MNANGKVRCPACGAPARPRERRTFVDFVCTLCAWKGGLYWVKGMRRHQELNEWEEEYRDVTV